MDHARIDDARKTELDVLVVESTPGAARQEIEALEAAGHRIHRCHEPHEPGFPCRAVSGAAPCPLDEGIDVGLLVRRGVAPRATDHELAVSCLLRAGVPVVEEGSAILDPYEGYVTRVTGDVAAACDAAVDDAYAPLREAISVRIEKLMAGAGHRASDVEVTFRRRGTDLRIDLVGPKVPETVRQALGVRVLDALRSAGRTFGKVDVDYTIH